MLFYLWWLPLFSGGEGEEAVPEHSGLLCPRVLVDDAHDPAVLVTPRYVPRVLVHYRCSP